MPDGVLGPGPCPEVAEHAIPHREPFDRCVDRLDHAGDVCSGHRT